MGRGSNDGCARGAEAMPMIATTNPRCTTVTPVLILVVALDSHCRRV